MPAKSKTTKKGGVKRPGAGAVSAAAEADAAAPVASSERERPITKLSRVVAMLSREGGASLEELTTATGWLPHTTRAALTGLRRKGYTIERLPGVAGAASRHRIVTNTAA